MDSVSSACNNEENTARDLTSYTIRKIKKSSAFQSSMLEYFFFFKSKH